MKRIWKFLLGTATSLVIVATLHAMVVKYNTYLVNEAGLSSNKTYPIPLNSYGIDYLSFTATASSVTFSNDSFKDGQQSTGTITVAANTGLSAVAASDNLTIVSTNIASNAFLTINGVTLTNGIQWFQDVTTTDTAHSLYTAIFSNVPSVKVSTGGNGSVIFTTSTVLGSGGNNMMYTSNVSTNVISFNTYTSSTPTGATSQFSGGKDSATLTINGFFIGFTPAGTSSGTALSIAQGINSNSSLNTIVTSSVSNGGTIVFATSTQVGNVTNYVMTSSTDSSLTIGGSTKTITGLNGASIGQMWGGLDSAISFLAPSTFTTFITLTNHGYPTALPVYLSTSGSNSISPLTNGGTYYVIPVTANSISLSNTSTGAVAGLAFVYTSSNTKTTTDTFTLVPLAISGTPAYKWEISNDGTNWFPYTANSSNVSVSSVSLSSYISTGTVTSWDFGNVDYAFIRLNVTAPTQGAIKLQVVGNGKNSTQ